MPFHQFLRVKERESQALRLEQVILKREFNPISNCSSLLGSSSQLSSLAGPSSSLPTFSRSTMITSRP